MMLVLTLTLFSHSNSVHMLRNCGPGQQGLTRPGQQTHLSLIAVRRVDVVKNVDVDVVEDDASAVGGPGPIIKDVAKDDARLGARDLDRRLDALEAVRAEGVRDGPLGNLEVAQRRKFDRQILQRVHRLVDDEHIEVDVELVDVHVGLGVDRVREAGELDDPAELREEVVVLARLARRFGQIRVVLCDVSVVSPG